MSIAKSSDSSREPNESEYAWGRTESEADLDISICFIIIIGADALLAESRTPLLDVANRSKPR